MSCLADQVSPGGALRAALCLAMLTTTAPAFGIASMQEPADAPATTRAPDSTAQIIGERQLAPAGGASILCSVARTADWPALWLLSSSPLQPGFQQPTCVVPAPARDGRRLSLAD